MPSPNILVTWNRGVKCGWAVPACSDLMSLSGTTEDEVYRIITGDTAGKRHQDTLTTLSVWKK